MSSENPGRRFVDEEFPEHLRPLLPSALRRAYAAADETIEKNPYLRTPGGRYERGDLIMVAASYEFQILVASGALPFDGSWEFFARPTGKHFVLRTPRACITASQVADPRKKPRRATFRENYAEDNALTLFPVDRPSVSDEERRHILILHGYQELNFLHLAFPHPEENRHIYRSENLMRLPHEISVSSDLPPAEGPTESPEPEAIERIERYLRDHDKSF